MKSILLLLSAILLSSCGTTPVLPRNPDGTVDWEEAERIGREIKDARDAREEAEQDGPDTPSENPSKDPSKKANVSEFPDGITWLHPDVSSWPVTSGLSVSVGTSRITLDYDKANVWPAREEAGATVNANPWVVAEIDGTWYAGTWEWMRYGQTVKNRVINGGHVKRSPMDGDWEPEQGQRFGIFVSGLIRGRTRNVQERTELVWVVWP